MEIVLLHHPAGARRRVGVTLAVVALLASITVVMSPTAARAAAPSHVSFTLEGCRTPVGNLATADYLCENGEGGTYTTGNLGKGWNELDLVPHRLTSRAGQAAPSTQTFTVGLAADNIESDVAGYDFMSEPVLNDALSDDSCEVTSVGAQQVITPGVGGTDTSIGRQVTIYQEEDTECVIDWVQRLALGSAAFPGSSLHTNRTNEAWSTQGVGAADVSIPVNEILPQVLSKTMSASRGSDHTWRLSKTANPVDLDFANTCLDETGARQDTVNITITWERLAASPSGDVTISTTISATNPAHRPVSVDVTDRIYEGTTQATQVSSASASDVMVPANSTIPVLTHTATVSSTATTFNDVATATYTDVEFPDVEIPGQTTATASADVQVSTDASNDTATITDTESITGAGLTFSVATPSVGSFTGGYVAGTPTTGPVGWSSGTVSGSGSVTFTKTVYVDEPRETSGVLSDTAELVASDGFELTGPNAATASTNITSSALVDLELVKTIPDVVGTGDSIDITFELRDSTDAVVDTHTFTFGPGDTQKSHTFTGLDPDEYTLVETDTGGFAPQADQVVDLSANADGTVPLCSDSVQVDNGFAPASVRVAKHTLPAGNEAGWTFTLDGPESGLPENLVTTGTGYHLFTTTIETDGTYTVTETEQGGWDLTKVELDGQEVTGPTCSFTLDFPTDAGRTISCDFTNVQRGTIIVEKNVVSQNASANDVVFGYTGDASGSIRDTSTHDERITVSNLQPGTYTSTETDPTPDFDLTAISCDDGASATASTWDLGTRRATFELDPGETITCTFENTERGMARVIKRVQDAAGTHLATTGEFTFQIRQGASTLVSGTVLEQLSTDANGEVNFTTKLVPGQTYNLCEVGMMPGWTNTLTGYTPDSETPEGGDNSSECVDFTVSAGETAVFDVTNVAPPGGDARTIGFWKNWSGDCTGGNQADVLGDTLTDAGGIVIGDLNVDDPCGEAVPLLDKSDIDSGKKKASDAAYALAAQLLAARLNIEADAGSCAAANQAMADGQALLESIDFTGTGDYLDPKSIKGKNPAALELQALAADAHSLAATLDAYNNNELC